MSYSGSPSSAHPAPFQRTRSTCTFWTDVHATALSPGAQPLRSDVPCSVHGLALWVADPFMIHIASDLLYSVETGKPAVEHLYGKPAFEFIAAMPRFKKPSTRE